MILSIGHRRGSSTNNRRPEKFASWCCQNTSPRITPDKTKLLFIGARQMLQNVPADMDATLSFNDHIKSISSSRLSSLCQINRVKHLLEQNRLQNSRFFFSKSVKKSVKRAVRVLRARGARASPRSRPFV